ncbi:VOC family protein [Rhizorhapis sp. SPR117]|uniref:VOC family protein n=1 Tax=Rhizorhapis sp. SPR117 TaxID=2912611 RepID=UPI001F15F88C|nr:VOC family protein [Rhizorhapis sp. SPR117]
MQATSTLRLHHIGFVVEKLEEAAAHYQDNLGYCIESPVIDDLGQGATVQFLRQPGALHWLELVSPLGGGSSLWKALDRGTSLHHQCYETEDIAASLGQLRSNGCMALGRPQPGAAFAGRPIAWMMDPYKGLIELVEAGEGARSLAELDRLNQEAVHA